MVKGWGSNKHHSLTHHLGSWLGHEFPYALSVEVIVVVRAMVVVSRGSTVQWLKWTTWKCGNQHFDHYVPSFEVTSIAQEHKAIEHH